MIVTSSIIVVIALLGLPLTFAAYNYAGWESVKVTAYGTDLIENDPNPGMISFIVATSPQGSEISNLISATLSNSFGWETNRTLLPGDFVSIDYSNRSVVVLNLTASSEPGYFIINYEGDANSIIINTSQIPEFPSWLMLPLFLVLAPIVVVIRNKIPKKLLK